MSSSSSIAARLGTLQGDDTILAMLRADSCLLTGRVGKARARLFKANNQCTQDAKADRCVATMIAEGFRTKNTHPKQSIGRYAMATAVSKNDVTWWMLI
jgi:hypothetical protein